jgi:hypothetical protein
MTSGMSSAAASPRVPAASGNWLLTFVWVQFGCQILLLVPELNEVRILVRSAAFLASFALLLWLPLRRGKLFAEQLWGVAILVVMGVAAFHPLSTEPLASVAQIAIYVSILGPMFWVSRLNVTDQVFHRLILTFWFFYMASAVTGVLQAYFPGQFQPTLSTAIESRGEWYVRSLQVELASGAVIFRPMGLTDVPGGAAQGGLYAVLFGMGVLQTRRLFPGAHGLAIVSVLVGTICLYLCHVRSLLVMAGISVVSLAGVFALSGRFTRVVALAALAFLAAVSAFLLAEALGGESMLARLSTLVVEDAGTVYYKNRGQFFEDTVVNLLPTYPLGAGLGRWGMMGKYFGSGIEQIFVEIQWTGWLLDGGVPLIIAYVGALFSVGRSTFGLAMRGNEVGPESWAPTIVAYNIGAFALCFNYAVFIGTSGIEFWLLNATLLWAVRLRKRTSTTKPHSTLDEELDSLTQSPGQGTQRPQ